MFIPCHRWDLKAEIYGVQTRSYASPPEFQYWSHINTSGLLGVTDIIYGDGSENSFTGGFWGLTGHEDGHFYATEFVDGAGEDCRLVRVGMNTFVQARRVGVVPIGFPSVEGLASARGNLYGSSIDYASHTSRLIRIDAETGQGVLIGSGSVNVILVGLAYHKGAQKLYGCGVPFGSGPDAVDGFNLYEVNIETGATILIGALGTELQGLAYDANLGLTGTFHQLFTIDTGSGSATVVEAAVDFAHDGHPLNGIYACASTDELQKAESDLFKIIRIVYSGESGIEIHWEAEPGGVYQMQASGQAQNNIQWANASGELTAIQPSISYHFIPTNDQSIYRIVRLK
ncbi:MAG: hypothetical protein LR011_11035 [Verrucomicrobia bacterium]|nr:hypothetical protein [Verrucomicrobiota bacterium]